MVTVVKSPESKLIHNLQGLYSGMILPLEVLKLVVFVTRLSSAVAGFELYPFGPGAGDTNLPIKDDSTSQRILVPEFPFFGKNFTELYVSTKLF